MLDVCRIQPAWAAVHGTALNDSKKLRWFTEPNYRLNNQQNPNYTKLCSMLNQKKEPNQQWPFDRWLFHAPVTTWPPPSPPPLPRWLRRTPSCQLTAWKKGWERAPPFSGVNTTSDFVDSEEDEFCWYFWVKCFVRQHMNGQSFTSYHSDELENCSILTKTTNGLIKGLHCASSTCGGFGAASLADPILCVWRPVQTCHSLNISKPWTSRMNWPFYLFCSLANGTI